MVPARLYFSTAAVLVVLLVAGVGCTGLRLAARDRAEQVGVAQPTQTHGSNCVADFDGDGIPDVLLNDHGSVWPLLAGRRDGTFVPYHQGLTDIRTDGHGCAVADFNGDGRLDVYLAIGACQGTCASPKQLWIQQPDHTFVNEAAQFGIDDPYGRGRVPVSLNANGDSLPDLFTGQETGVKFPSLNRLWINHGDHFVLQTGPATNDLGNICSAAADIDGDGYDELAVCTPSHGFFIYRRNAQGIYEVATSTFGVTSTGRRMVHFVDVNGDGRPDLATVERTQVQLFLNDGGRYDSTPTFSVNVTDGRDVAFGDCDGDGDLDMFVLQGSGLGGRLYLSANGRWTPSMQVPAPLDGSGDAVDAIAHYAGSRRAAFLVNNGFENFTGTRQLWQFGITVAP